MAARCGVSSRRAKESAKARAGGAVGGAGRRPGGGPDWRRFDRGILLALGGALGVLAGAPALAHAWGSGGGVPVPPGMYAAWLLGTVVASLLIGFLAARRSSSGLGAPAFAFGSALALLLRVGDVASLLSTASRPVGELAAAFFVLVFVLAAGYLPPSLGSPTGLCTGMLAALAFLDGLSAGLSLTGGVGGTVAAGPSLGLALQYASAGAALGVVASGERPWILAAVLGGLAGGLSVGLVGAYWVMPFAQVVSAAFGLGFILRFGRKALQSADDEWAAAAGFLLAACGLVFMWI